MKLSAARWSVGLAALLGTAASCAEIIGLEPIPETASGGGGSSSSSKPSASSTGGAIGGGGSGGGACSCFASVDGWNGPAALAPSGTMVCPDGTTGAQKAAIAPSSLDCTGADCGCEPVDGACEIELFAYSSTDCTGTPAGITVQSGACETPSFTVDSIKLGATAHSGLDGCMPSVPGGTCDAPQPEPVLLCAPVAAEGSCPKGACLERLDGGPICVWMKGDTMCPSAYPTRLASEIFEDFHVDSCACGMITTQDCTPTLVATHDAMACGGNATPVNLCTTPLSVQSIDYVPNNAGTCLRQEPTVSRTSQLTVCCTP